jgi:hypothetical protein
MIYNRKFLFSFSYIQRILQGIVLLLYKCRRTGDGLGDYSAIKRLNDYISVTYSSCTRLVGLRGDSLLAVLEIDNLKRIEIQIKTIKDEPIYTWAAQQLE